MCVSSVNKPGCAPWITRPFGNPLAAALYTTRACVQRTGMKKTSNYSTNRQGGQARQSHIAEVILFAISFAVVMPGSVVVALGESFAEAPGATDDGLPGSASAEPRECVESFVLRANELLAAEGADVGANCLLFTPDEWAEFEAALWDLLGEGSATFRWVLQGPFALGTICGSSVPLQRGPESRFPDPAPRWHKALFVGT